MSLPPSVVLPLPTTARLENKARIAMKKTVPSGAVTSAPTRATVSSSLKKRSYLQNQGRVRTYSTASPIPSLHDPFKDNKFSEECQNFLQRLEYDTDWLHPVVSTSNTFIEQPHGKLVSSNIIEEGGDAAAPKQESFEVRIPPAQPTEEVVRKSFQDTIPNATLLSSAAHARQIEPDAEPSSAPVVNIVSTAPVSRTGPTLLRPSQITRPKKSPWSAQKDDAISAPSPNTSRSVSRPSPTRSVMKINTFTGVEGQIQLHSKLTRNEPALRTHLMEDSSPSAIHRQSGPPPTIPLPALPLEAQDTSSDVTTPSTDREGAELQRRGSSETSLDFGHRRHQGPRADKVRERRNRDLAKIRSRSQEIKGEKQVEAIRQQLNPIEFSKPQTTSKQHVDELDRFPAVPDSRPTSIGSISVRSTYSRQQSPGKDNCPLFRMSSRRSDGYSVSPPEQVLSQSNIFVVVDSDPVTARFRASDISAVSSMGPSSPESRSPKHARSPSKPKEAVIDHFDQSHVRDAVLGSTRGTPVLLPGPFSPGSSSSHKRPASGSRKQSSSSDELSLQVPGLVSPKPPQSILKKRRRWNSGDISLVKILQRDLEEYYATIQKQEEKIRWQAQQIQMMARVFAPMGRIRGVKSPSLLQNSPELPPTEGEHESIRQPVRNSWHGSKDWQVRSAPARALPLSIVEEQTINSQGSVTTINRDNTNGTPLASETSTTVALTENLGAEANDTFKDVPTYVKQIDEEQRNGVQPRYYK